VELCTSGKEWEEIGQRVGKSTGVLGGLVRRDGLRLRWRNDQNRVKRGRRAFDPDGGNG
jgi:hypothetical protein